MKKLLGKTLSLKLITVVLGVLLAGSVVLLLRLGLFSVPWYDDYSYPRYTKSFQEVYGYGIVNALRGALFQVRESWYSWQGTFSSIFLMAFSPLVWGEQYYFLGSVFLILILTLSVIVLIRVITDRVFGMSKDASWCLSLAAAILAVWRLYCVCHAFYWYNAGIHYVGMHSFMMLFTATLICLIDRKSVANTVFKAVLSCILALLCSGANFVTALQGLLILLFIAVVSAVFRKRKIYVFIPAFVVYMTGFIINVIAPGNARRAALYAGRSMSATEAVLKSFPEALRFLWKFTGLFTLAFLIMAAPVIWKGLKDSKFNFRLPGLVVLFAFCFYATSFTPNLYGTGRIDLDRVINVAKITYQMLLIISEIYVLGWLKNKLKNPAEDIGFVWIYAVCVLVLGVVFAVSPLDRIQYSPYGAYYYVHSGEAAAFHDGYLRRVEEIKRQGPDVLVVKNVFRPPYLFVGELSEDPEYEPNTFMADWYDKSSIAIIPDGE